MSQQVALTDPTTVFVAAGPQTECASCGVIFWMTAQLEAKRREDHARFYCPNGHNLVFNGETEAEKLKRQLKWERDMRAAVSAERDQAKASLRTTKGVVTKLRKRTIEGDCPLCGQHLRDLARHIGRIHPDATAELPEAEATA